MIDIHYLDVEFQIEAHQQLVNWLKTTISIESFSVGSINLILCSDEYLLSLNQQFLDHDYYTDILTFDTSEDKILSGDLYISIERVTENSLNIGTSLTDELHRVMVHGILHLCGYGDKSDDEAAIMRSKEDHYLSLRPFV